MTRTICVDALTGGVQKRLNPVTAKRRIFCAYVLTVGQVVMVFWGTDLVVAVLFTYLLFCRKSFRLDQENLVMKSDVLGFKRCKTIPKNSIQRLVQVKDGGEGKDSFPSWGLKVEGINKATLIFRQPYEKSHWLGQILSKWAGVEFVKVSKE